MRCWARVRMVGRRESTAVGAKAAAEVEVCGTIGGGDEAVVGEWGLGGYCLDELAGTAGGDTGIGGESVVVAEDGGGVGVGGDDPGLLDGAPVDGIVEAELAEAAVRVGPGFVDGGVEVGLGGAYRGGT